MISGEDSRRISHPAVALPREQGAEWKEVLAQEPLAHGSHPLTGAAFSATGRSSLP